MYGIHVLSCPTNSPDLNPIENLWKIAEKKVAACRLTTLEQLKVSMKQVWSSIIPADCQTLVSLVESMPTQVQAMIAANGGPTKYRRLV